jgi:hypothetical protein
VNCRNWVSRSKSASSESQLFGWSSSFDWLSHYDDCSSRRRDISSRSWQES